MPRRAAAFAAALALLAGVAPSSYVHAEPRAAPARCASVRVEVDAERHKVYVDLRNACEARVGCDVSWTLRCGRGAAEQRSERVMLDGRGEHRVEASALSCGDDDWRISTPRWRCDSVDQASRSSRR